MIEKVAVPVLEDILEWSEKLPRWQRDGLRRIVQQDQLSDEDYLDLVQLCEQDHGLADPEKHPLEERPLTEDDLPTVASGARGVAILCIGHVENVNAVCGKQELLFDGHGLNIIFGYNGAGKTGYGRILKRACRARRKGEPIIPNVLDASPGKSLDPASAEVQYAIDGVEQKPEQWIDGVRDIPMLRSVSFFDSECGLAHVGDKNEIAFTPFGLDVLPKLGQTCKKVQALLEQEKEREELARPEFLHANKTRPDTGVGRLLASLGAATDPTYLAQLAGISADETERLKQVRVELANDPKKATEAVRTRIRRLTMLADILAEGAMVLSDESIAKIEGLSKDYMAKKSAAAVAAENLFVGEPLPEVGGTVWRELWEAARRYSTGQAYPGESFPFVQEGARCVLCMQTVDRQAAERLRKFEDFVRDTTASRASQAKRDLDGALAGVNSLRLRDPIVKELLEELRVESQGLWPAARASLAAHLRRIRWLDQSVESDNWDNSRAATVDVDVDLRRFIAELETRADDFAALEDKEQRTKLQNELAELEDRQWLGTVVGGVKVELGRLKRIEALGKCIAETRTNTITAKSKELAKAHVTDQLRRAFAAEVKALQQGVHRVEVELSGTTGEYGASLYKVQLVGASNMAVERVLCDGEHRCIALAGFLAELSTQEVKSCIVLDDPVTSLDHRWRHCLARRLSEEGKNRQVIVFTHDIVFLHDLMGCAEDLKTSCKVQRVESDRERTGVVSESIPWEAQTPLQQIDELEKMARATRPLFDKGADDEYFRQAREVYSHLRSAVESVVEQVVFGGVVCRFRDYINLKNLEKATAFSSGDCERIQTVFEKACDMTSAHSRAAARSLAPPSPDEILGDIKELRTIIEVMKDRQKKLRKS